MEQQSLEGQGIMITLWHTTLGTISLDERSARWRHLYMTTLGKYRHTSPRGIRTRYPSKRAVTDGAASGWTRLHPATDLRPNCLFSWTKKFTIPKPSSDRKRKLTSAFPSYTVKCLSFMYRSYRAGPDLKTGLPEYGGEELLFQFWS